MIMKMHSYITVNGQMQYVQHRSEKLMRRLRKATDAAGGWDNAVALAQAKIDAQRSPSELSTPPNGSAGNSSTHEPTPIGTPKAPEGSSTSYVDAKTANALRKRLVTVAAQNGPNTRIRDEDVGLRSMNKRISNDSADGASTFVVEEDLPEGFVPHPLVAHPNAEISAMANDYSELQSEMVSTPTGIKWPDTITWKGFAVYQLIPTLVYELEYPRTDRYVTPPSAVSPPLKIQSYRIRPLYVFEKTVRMISAKYHRGYNATPLGCYFRNLRPSILCHGKFHPSIYTNSRPILPAVLTGPSATIHDGILAAILHHIRYVMRLVLCAWFMLLLRTTLTSHVCRMHM